MSVCVCVCVCVCACVCPWVRQELHEWFVAMRYSIDWKACEQSLPRSSGRKNALGASRGRCCDTR